MGQHKTSIHWERDTEHFNIKSFNRDHVIRFENEVVIHATSAPEYTGNPDLIRRKIFLSLPFPVAT